MRTVRILALGASFTACATATSTTSPSSRPLQRSIGTDDSGLIVTDAPSLGRPCEVIALVDLHSQAGSAEAGFAELRRWATTLGGEAVVAAHFEPAQPGEPAHVSGVVVRSKTIDPRPYDVIAELDVQTAEDSANKGLEALRARGRELGADKLVDVRFEHGDSGVSHLRARAVRYRR